LRRTLLPNECVELVQVDDQSKILSAFCLGSVKALLPQLST
jgi:hypothetical protein